MSSFYNIPSITLSPSPSCIAEACAESVLESPTIWPIPGAFEVTEEEEQALPAPSGVSTTNALGLQLKDLANRARERRSSSHDVPTVSSTGSTKENGTGFVKHHRRSSAPVDGYFPKKPEVSHVHLPPVSSSSSTLTRHSHIHIPNMVEEEESQSRWHELNVYRASKAAAAAVALQTPPESPSVFGFGLPSLSTPYALYQAAVTMYGNAMGSSTSSQSSGHTSPPFSDSDSDETCSQSSDGESHASMTTSPPSSPPKHQQPLLSRPTLSHRPTSSFPPTLEQISAQYSPAALAERRATIAGVKTSRLPSFLREKQDSEARRRKSMPPIPTICLTPAPMELSDELPVFKRSSPHGRRGGLSVSSDHWI